VCVEKKNRGICTFNGLSFWGETVTLELTEYDGLCVMYGVASCGLDTWLIIDRGEYAHLEGGTYLMITIGLGLDEPVVHITNNFRVDERPHNKVPFASRKPIGTNNPQTKITMPEPHYTILPLPSRHKADPNQKRIRPHTLSMIYDVPTVAEPRKRLGTRECKETQIRPTDSRTHKNTTIGGSTISKTCKNNAHTTHAQ